MSTIDDPKTSALIPNPGATPAAERLSLGKFELKYGPQQLGEMARPNLQRDISKIERLELTYNSPYSPEITLGKDIKLDLKPGATTAPKDQGNAPTAPTIDQQRQALEAQRKQLSPKTWEEFTRTWASKGIEEYKKALSEYDAKVAEFQKLAGEKTASGLALKITAGEMGFKTRLLATAKRDGVETAIIARKLLTTEMKSAAVTALTSTLSPAARQAVVRAFNSLDSDSNEQKAVYAAISGSPAKSRESVVASTPKKKKKHFGEPEMEITVRTADKDKAAKP